MPAPSFSAFVLLGIRHILGGYDHLLFLLGLFLACERWRTLVVIVSCFTVAHSLTLALATLGYVHLPARIVEPGIAATIAFVGLENLFRPHEPRGRWIYAFAFGLIHGLGFASVLIDLGLGSDRRSLLVPLFSFNLGVELGQLVVAALVLPLLWRLKRHPAFARRGVPALSALVALAGLCWFCERLLT